MAGRVPFDPFGAMLEGYRQADADNKQDLSFNAALEGAWLGNDAKHVQNLFNYDTYGLSAQMAQNQAKQSARNNAVGDATHQGNIAAGKMHSLGQTGDYQTYFNNLAKINAQKQDNLVAALKSATYQSQYWPDITKQELINQGHAGGVYIGRDKDNYNYEQQVREARLAAMLGGNHAPSGVSLGLPTTDAVTNPLEFGYNNYAPPGSSADLLAGTTFLGKMPNTGTQPYNWLAPTPSAGSAQPTATTTGGVVGGASAPTAQAPPQIANGPWGDAVLAPPLPSNLQNVLASGLLGAYANTQNLLGPIPQAPTLWGRLLAEYLR